MSENPNITNYNLGNILQGENQFETGTLTLAAGTSITEGAFLKRGDDGTFALVTDTSTETPIALYIGDKLINSDTEAKGYAVRVLISGRVKADACNVNGTAATDAELDMIRSYGIVPVRVTETNIQDNQ
ncbi:MAG: hypothetical protein IJ191_09110 [Treponema sp.]|nr:hypothetical protein [Treponema sp.]